MICSTCGEPCDHEPVIHVDHYGHWPEWTPTNQGETTMDNNNDARYIAASTEYARAARSTGTAYLVWLFFGFFGGHQFYMGKTGRGLAYLFTFAFLTIGAWVDMFTMGSQVRNRNREIEAEIFARHGLPTPSESAATTVPTEPTPTN